MGKIEKCAMRLVAHKKSKIEMQLEKDLNLIVSDVRMTKTFVSQSAKSIINLNEQFYHYLLDLIIIN